MLSLGRSRFMEPLAVDGGVMLAAECNRCTSVESLGMCETFRRMPNITCTRRVKRSVTHNFEMQTAASEDEEKSTVLNTITSKIRL